MMKKFCLVSLPLVLLVVSSLFVFLTYFEKPSAKSKSNSSFSPLTGEKQEKPKAALVLIRVEEEVLSSRFLPKDTVVTTDLGDDLMVLVNKVVRLPDDYVPADLVVLDNTVSAYPGLMLREQAAEAVKEMFEVAEAEGLKLTVTSAYRSYSQQQVVFESWANSAGLAKAEVFSAKPGHSQHQLGTAVDVSGVGQNPFSEAFSQTKEGVWLANNTYRFGFVLSYPKGKEALTGYAFEPWHYRYIGRENAKRMLDSGLVLEAFLQKYGVW